MPYITIDSSNILRGESSADYLSDGGFSPDSYGLNLTKSPGVISFVEASTDRGGATLTGNLIGACYDTRATVSGIESFFVDDEGAFYSINGSTFTKLQTAGGSGTWTLGTTDMLAFQSDFFATNNYEVVRLTNGGANIDSYFWTVTGANSSLNTLYRHPLERVEDKMYIGDGNLIHTWDGTVDTPSAVTLPTNVNITSLRRHPDGRTLLAFCGVTPNGSHILGGGGMVYYVDTNLKTWTREVKLDAQVEGSKVVGGIIYVSYGQNIGYFNGDGLVFLKKLETSTTTYNQSMCDFEDKLVVRDGLNAKCFGKIGGNGGRVWWNIFQNDVNSDHLTIPVYKGDNKMMYAFDNGSDGYLREVDYDNVGANGRFYTNRFWFPELVTVNSILVNHAVTNAIGLTQILFRSRDTENTVSTIKDALYTNQSSVITRDNPAIRTNHFQLLLQPNQGTPQIKFTSIGYESNR